MIGKYFGRNIQIIFFINLFDKLFKVMIETSYYSERVDENMMK